MGEDWFDEEIGRIRSDLTRAPEFPSAALWSALSPILAARARKRRILRSVMISSFGAVCFFGGWTLNRGAAPAAVARDPLPAAEHQSPALEVQQAGALLITKLATVRGTLERDGGSREMASQAHSVAVAVLTGATAELTRMDPSDTRLAEILRLTTEARAQSNGRRDNENLR